MVLPELVELARDEGSTVRLAAFDTIINLLEMFDSGEWPLSLPETERKGCISVLAHMNNTRSVRE